MKSNEVQNIAQELISILFTELDLKSIEKLKNNENFMNCINKLQNVNNYNNTDISEIENEKKILNPEAYERYCKKNPVIDKYRNV